MRVIVYPETWRSANNYLIQADRVYLIDPSLVPEKIALRPDYLIATHGHFDHIAACDQWRERGPSQFLIGAPDEDKLTDIEANCSTLFCQPQTYLKADQLIDQDSLIEFEDGLRFQVKFTPGHTSGSLCLLLESKLPLEKWQFLTGPVRSEDLKIPEDLGQFAESDDLSFKPVALFTGDTVFAQSIGRTDLASGDSQEMAKSLKAFAEWAGQLPGQILVFPGHGNPIRLADLLQTNPYLKNLS